MVLIAVQKVKKARHRCCERSACLFFSSFSSLQFLPSLNSVNVFALVQMKPLNHLSVLSPSNYMGLYEIFARLNYSVLLSLKQTIFLYVYVYVCVWFTGLNYLSFSLGFAFKPFLASIIGNKLASAHSNPKANLFDVFSVFSESSLSVLNSKPVACLQLGELSVKHKSSYHKLSNWSRFVNATPV